MGGVRDEAPAHLLGGLEPAGELVELPGQLTELVAALDDHPVAVLALPDDADGPQQGGGPGSKERARVDQADPDIGAEGMGDLSRHRCYLPFQQKRLFLINQSVQ